MTEVHPRAVWNQAKVSEIVTSNPNDWTNIFGPDTTFINLFVLMTKNEEMPLPDQFIEKIKAHIALTKKVGMKYALAYDSFVLNDKQNEFMEIFRLQFDINLIDISKLDKYRPYKKHSDLYKYTCQNTYWDTCVSSTAEFIDKAKVMLVNLAGREYNGTTYKNILVVDPDIDFKSTELYIRNDSTIAFTNTFLHSKPSTHFGTENSMIYVSESRPTFMKDGSKQDLLEDFVLSRILENIEHNPRRMQNRKYGCFVFSTSSHDLIFKMEDTQSDDFTTLVLAGANRDNENKRATKINSIVENGKYLLVGDYCSDNMATWSNPSGLLTFSKFEN